MHTVGLVPVHPATAGISAATLRKLVWEDYGPMPPRGGAAALGAAGGRAAARPAGGRGRTHFPDTEEEEAGARRRLAFEELFLLQLAVAGRRRARREGRRAAPSRRAAAGRAVARGASVRAHRRPAGRRATQIDADLAERAADAAAADGGGGRGKTVVALHAMLRAVEKGRQAALMAPTETLAEQHLLTLDRLLDGAAPVELLTGSTRRGSPARPARAAGVRASWRWWWAPTR